MKKFLKWYWSTTLIFIVCIGIGYVISENVSSRWTLILLKISLPFVLFLMIVVSVGLAKSVIDKNSRKKKNNPVAAFGGRDH